MTIMAAVETDKVMETSAALDVIACFALVVLLIAALLLLLLSGAVVEPTINFVSGPSKALNLLRDRSKLLSIDSLNKYLLQALLIK